MDEPPAEVPTEYHDNQDTFFAIQEGINSWRPGSNFEENGATVGMARYCLFVQFNIDVHTSETGVDTTRTDQSLIEEGGLFVRSFYVYLLNTCFTDDLGNNVQSYRIDEAEVFVTVRDFDENFDGMVVESVSVTVTNWVNADAEVVELLETGSDTGVFRNPVGLPLSSELYEPGNVNDGILQVAIGAELVVTHVDADFPQSTSRGSALVLAGSGDLDGDGDVDLDDYAIFAVCLAGPNQSVPPDGCSQEQFDSTDLDLDDDVDLSDFARFQEVFTGS